MLNLGGVTGLVDGEVEEEISESFYLDESIVIFSPSDIYQFELFGTGAGTYSLALLSYTNGESNIFNSIEIPITANEIHRYSIDWLALSQGEDGVTVQIDDDGDDMFEEVITADNDLTEAEFMLQTATTIDFDPDTLYLDSKSRWITAYIELPEGYDYDVSMIDVASLRLNNLIEAELKPVKIGDYNENGVADIMVKFSGSAVQEILSVGDVDLSLSGNLYDGRQFRGSGIIKAICPP